MKSGIVFALAMVLASPVLADITVTDPWARASILAARPGAAYLTIHSTQDDRLIELSSPMAGKVMIHAVETGADGVSRMRHIMALELPEGQVVTLAPGDMHLMLMGLAAKLEEGTSFPMTLTFEKAGEVAVEVQVLSATATGPQGDGQ